MQHVHPLERILRVIALTLVVLFFMFPIVWIFLMSFQTNETILRVPPSVVFSPTLENYTALISGKLQTSAGILEISFMKNLFNSFFLSVTSVAIGLLLGVPAAYAFARLKFRGSEDIAFTLLSFRFAPPLLVLLPLTIYFQQIGLSDTYVGLIWVYQLIVLPLILWIVRGYFEDMPADIEYAYRIAGHSWGATFRKIALPLAGPGIAAAALLAFIFAGTTSFCTGACIGGQTAGDGGCACLRDSLRHPVRTSRSGHRALDCAYFRHRTLCPTLSRRGLVARRGERVRHVHITEKHP